MKILYNLHFEVSKKDLDGNCYYALCITRNHDGAFVHCQIDHSSNVFAAFREAGISHERLSYQTSYNITARDWKRRWHDAPYVTTKKQIDALFRAFRRQEKS